MHQLFSFNDFTVSYRVYGSGLDPILAFHGFGVDGKVYEAFAEALSPLFVMVCVDVIFHGASSLPRGRTHDQPLQYQELVDVHYALMNELGFDEFWYAGHSMGGRLALGMAHQNMSRCKGLLLFAPDGLVYRPWYRSMAHSKLGHKLYDRWVEKPGFFDFIVRSAFTLRLIDERMLTFLMEHSASYDQRSLVRAIWFSLRLIEPELKQVTENVKQAGVEVWLFVGKHDSIIKPRHSKKLRRLLGNNMHFHALDTGHAMIFNRTGRNILGLLRKAKGA